MVAKANTESQSRLAKLLAKENIQVHIGNYHTAFFDVKQRLLGLPTWNTDSKNVSDLLIGHEVGHALHTPTDAISLFQERYPNIPFDVANIVEDIRIERLIRDNYPGLVFCFKEGYRHFIEKDFFKIKDIDVNKLNFIDRLNLRGKIGNLVDIPLSKKEETIYQRCLAAETYDEVLDICKDVIKLAKIKAQKPQEDSDQSQGQNDDDDMTPSVPTNSQSSSSSSESNNDSQKDSESQNSSQSSNDDGAKDESPRKFQGASSPSESENNTTLNDSQSTGKKAQSRQEDKRSLEEELKSQTLNSLNENVKNLQSNDVNNVVGNSPTTKQLLSKIVSIDKVMAERKRVSERYDYTMNHPAVVEDWTSFKNATKKHIAILVKEFERRKAAYQYSRATSSRTGTLDVNRLHSFKFEDQIFKSVTRLADAKNHGMIFFIDYSGSMNNTLGRVISQTLQLVYFCKAVGIPFEVYGFTTPPYYTPGFNYEDGESVPNELPGYNLDLSHTHLCELVNSTMPKHTFELACRELRANAFVRDNTGKVQDPYIYSSKYETMNGTPLYETIIVAHAVVKRFRETHKVQKINTIFLTDGDGNSVRFNKNNSHEEFETSSKRWGVSVTVDINGNKMTFAGQDRNIYAKLIHNLKTTCDTTVIGFFLANYRSEFKNNSIGALRYSRNGKTLSWDEAVGIFNAKSKSARKEKCLAIENGFNYDVYFTFDSVKNLDINDDGEEFDCGDILSDKKFDVSSNTSQNKIAREFTKFHGEKKTSRVFLNKFVEFIA
jgi:hypothetical protein